MEPSEKCVSLETAQKLKAAGFPQDTERMVFSFGGDPRYATQKIEGVSDEFYFAAPDAQEIGELMPSIAGVAQGQYLVSYVRNKNRTYNGRDWAVLIEDVYQSKPINVFTNQNEAEARAACYLWLKEQKLI